MSGVPGKVSTGAGISLGADGYSTSSGTFSAGTTPPITGALNIDASGYGGTFLAATNTSGSSITMSLDATTNTMTVNGNVVVTGTVSEAAVSEGPLTITGGTVTVATPFLQATQSWNAAGVTFTGMKVNVTDTASASGSLLQDFQVGGVSKFSITKAGAVTAASNLSVATGAAYQINGTSVLSATTLGSSVVTSSLTTVGTLSAGAVPASLVTAGTFGAGAYTFPGALTATTSFTLTGAASANALAVINAPTAGWSAGLELQAAGVAKWRVGANSNPSGGTGVNAYDLYSYGTSSTVLSIAYATGAATFASSLAITGAFTGATTGAFSSTLTAGATTITASNATLALQPAVVSDPSYLRFRNSAGSDIAYIGYGAATSAGSTFYVNQQLAGSLQFNTNGTQRFTIDSAGAATFSSTLAVTGAATFSSTVSATGSNGTILLDSSSFATTLGITGNVAGNFDINNTTALGYLRLYGQAGITLRTATTCSSTLAVTGAATFSAIATFNGVAGNNAAYFKGSTTTNQSLGPYIDAGTSSSDYAFYVRAVTGGTAYFQIRGDGVVIAPFVYSTTVGATNRDVYVDSTGLLGYVSSIRASKTNITPLTDTSWLDALTPVAFNYRKKDEDGAWTDEANTPLEYGLIAEEVEGVNAELVFYDETEDGLALRGVSYNKLMIPLLQRVQALTARNDALTARVAALEAK